MATFALHRSSCTYVSLKAQEAGAYSSNIAVMVITSLWTNIVCTHYAAQSKYFRDLYDALLQVMYNKTFIRFVDTAPK